MEDVLQAWAPLAAVILAPLISYLVQKCKEKGTDPFFALAILSGAFSVAYAAIAQYSSPTVLRGIAEFLIMAGGTAVLAYDVFKKYIKDQSEDM